MTVPEEQASLVPRINMCLAMRRKRAEDRNF